MSCPICLEDIYDEFIILQIVIVPKQCFILKCVTSWFKIKNNCPICKCEFKNTLQLKKQDYLILIMHYFMTQSINIHCLNISNINIIYYIRV